MSPGAESAEAVGLDLTERDVRLLEGAETQAQALAMRLITKVADVMGADRLLDVTGAHIDSCLFHGEAGLDFAERLLEQETRVAVPTTLNVASLDLIHPELFRGDDSVARKGRRLMDCYEQMGCEPTWTCAPYQLPQRPSFGEHVAWAESNAIVYANSVLGARTHRYGDFIDICAAITGRAPAAGLHVTENRRGTVLFRLEGLSDRLLASDVLFPVVGHLIGAETGRAVPVIDGLPAGVDEERLKALGAAAAASGSIGMFHAVGVTPEAATLKEALGGYQPERTVTIGIDRLRAARDSLSTKGVDELGAVSLGTPHYSARELAALVGNRTVAAGVGMFVSTNRAALGEAEAAVAAVAAVERAGVQLVTDTCTYITPILDPATRVAMTDSAKWAYYAPSNLGIDVIFGSMAECVESAIAGRLLADRELWSDD